MNGKQIARYAGAFGLGALFSWAVTADHYDGKNKTKVEILEERIEILRAHAIKLETAYVELAEAVMEEQDENSSGETSGETAQIPARIETVEEPSEEEIAETRSNLQKLIDQYTPEDDDNEAFVESAARMELDRTPPFVISQEKYAYDEDEGDHFAKITLTYFQNHRLLVDDGEEPIADVANTVGWKNLNRFGEESGDPETVFIRNRPMRTDFEVILDTENDIPLHIKYGMGKEEFKTNYAAGLIKLREEDRA